MTKIVQMMPSTMLEITKFLALFDILVAPAISPTSASLFAWKGMFKFTACYFCPQNFDRIVCYNVWNFSLLIQLINYIRILALVSDNDDHVYQRYPRKYKKNLQLNKNNFYQCVFFLSLFTIFVGIRFFRNNL